MATWQSLYYFRTIFTLFENSSEELRSQIISALAEYNRPDLLIGFVLSQGPPEFLPHEFSQNMFEIIWRYVKNKSIEWTESIVLQFFSFFSGLLSIFRSRDFLKKIDEIYDHILGSYPVTESLWRELSRYSNSQLIAAYAAIHNQDLANNIYEQILYYVGRNDVSVHAYAVLVQNSNTDLRFTETNFRQIFEADSVSIGAKAELLRVLMEPKPDSNGFLLGSSFFERLIAKLPANPKDEDVIECLKCTVAVLNIRSRISIAGPSVQRIVELVFKSILPFVHSNTEGVLEDFCKLMAKNSALITEPLYVSLPRFAQTFLASRLPSSLTIPFLFQSPVNLDCLHFFLESHPVPYMYLAKIFEIIDMDWFSHLIGIINKEFGPFWQQLVIYLSIAKDFGKLKLISRLLLNTPKLYVSEAVNEAYVNIASEILVSSEKPSCCLSITAYLANCERHRRGLPEVELSRTAALVLKPRIVVSHTMVNSGRKDECDCASVVSVISQEISSIPHWRRDLLKVISSKISTTSDPIAVLLPLISNQYRKLEEFLLQTNSRTNLALFYQALISRSDKGMGYVMNYVQSERFSETALEVGLAAISKSGTLTEDCQFLFIEALKSPKLRSLSLKSMCEQLKGLPTRSCDLSDYIEKVLHVSEVQCHLEFESVCAEIIRVSCAFKDRERLVSILFGYPECESSWLTYVENGQEEFCKVLDEQLAKGYDASDCLKRNRVYLGRLQMLPFVLLNSAKDGEQDLVSEIKGLSSDESKYLLRRLLRQLNLSSESQCSSFRYYASYIANNIDNIATIVSDYGNKFRFPRASELFPFVRVFLYNTSFTLFDLLGELSRTKNGRFQQMILSHLCQSAKYKQEILEYMETRYYLEETSHRFLLTLLSEFIQFQVNEDVSDDIFSSLLLYVSTFLNEKFRVRLVDSCLVCLASKTGIFFGQMKEDLEETVIGFTQNFHLLAATVVNLYLDKIQKRICPHFGYIVGYLAISIGTKCPIGNRALHLFLSSQVMIHNHHLLFAEVDFSSIDHESILSLYQRLLTNGSLATLSRLLEYVPTSVLLETATTLIGQCLTRISTPSALTILDYLSQMEDIRNTLLYNRLFFEIIVPMSIDKYDTIGPMLSRVLQCDDNVYQCLFYHLITKWSSFDMYMCIVSSSLQRIKTIQVSSRHLERLYEIFKPVQYVEAFEGQIHDFLQVLCDLEKVWELKDVSRRMIICMRDHEPYVSASPMFVINL